MAKMIQVRNVPDRLHRELVRRAHARGETLTHFVQQVLERELTRPPAEEVFARVRRRSRVVLDRPVADLIRGQRGRRGAA
jgi:plasmid stability protein